MACEAGAGEVARAATEAGPAQVSPAAEMRAASEGVAAATEMAAAAATTVALRESLPAGEHGCECCHGPKSTFAG
jgi:hypothetical protein